MNNEIITNQDVENHKELVKFLAGQNITDKIALDDLIRQELYIEQAKKTEESISDEELNRHLSPLLKVQLPDGINMKQISHYIKNELLAKKVIEKQVIPLINITAEGIDNYKKNLPFNECKLEQINFDDDGQSKVELGWIEKSSLSEKISEALENSKVGGKSKIIRLDDKKVQFRLVDEGNTIVLSSKFEVKINDKSEPLIFSGKDVNYKDREKLLYLKPDEQTEIIYDNKKYEISMVKSDLDQVIRVKLYEKQFIEREKELQKQLRDATIVDIKK